MPSKYYLWSTHKDHCFFSGGLSWGALLGRVIEPEECGLSPDPENERVATIPTLQDAQTVMEATKILTIGMEELKKVCNGRFFGIGKVKKSTFYFLSYV